jgi:hypothetical protein
LAAIELFSGLSPEALDEAMVPARVRPTDRQPSQSRFFGLAQIHASTSRPIMPAMKSHGIGEPSKASRTSRNDRAVAGDPSNDLRNCR